MDKKSLRRQSTALALYVTRKGNRVCGYRDSPCSLSNISVNRNCAKVNYCHLPACSGTRGPSQLHQPLTTQALAVSPAVIHSSCQFLPTVVNHQLLWHTWVSPDFYHEPFAEGQRLLSTNSRKRHGGPAQVCEDQKSAFHTCCIFSTTLQVIPIFFLPPLLNSSPWTWVSLSIWHITVFYKCWIDNEHR